MTNTSPKVVEVKDYDLRRRIVALTVVPALFLASLLAAIPAVIIGGTTVTITMGVLTTVVAELLVIVWALWFTGFLKDWPQKFGLKNFKWKHLLLGLLAGEVFYWGLQGVALVAELLGSPVNSSDTAMSLGSLSGIEAIIMLFIMVPFVVPFIEEFLFRGIIVSSLQNSKWNAWWISILVSALSFGVMHIQGFSSITDIAILLWITFMGGVFAFLYLKTKSFWTVFAAHSIYNLTSSVIMATGIGS